VQGLIRECWLELAELAATEQDPRKMVTLMKEINNLLEAKERLKQNRLTAQKPESRHKRRIASLARLFRGSLRGEDDVGLGEQYSKPLQQIQPCFRLGTIPQLAAQMGELLRNGAEFIGCVGHGYLTQMNDVDTDLCMGSIPHIPYPNRAMTRTTVLSTPTKELYVLPL